MSVCSFDENTATQGLHSCLCQVLLGEKELNMVLSCSLSQAVHGNVSIDMKYKFISF